MNPHRASAPVRILGSAPGTARATDVSLLHKLASPAGRNEPSARGCTFLSEGSHFQLASESATAVSLGLPMVNRNKEGPIESEFCGGTDLGITHEYHVRLLNPVYARVIGRKTERTRSPMSSYPQP